MKRSIYATVMVLAGVLSGCDSQEPATDKCKGVMCATGQTCNATTGMCEGGTVDKCMGVSCTFPQACEAATGMCANPPMPSVTGALIDRMGRPGVNTALTNPFDLYQPMGATMPESSDTTKDRYNKDGMIAGWTAAWSPAILLHLGILDSLDKNCGNQFAAAPGAVSPTRYATLGAILANDALTVNLSRTTCNQYLGAEIAFATAGAVAANDCGGRTLSMDVIDVTYSALVTSMPTGVTDGNIGQNTMPMAAFPFLAAPR
jgi:hypothetical protein